MLELSQQTMQCRGQNPSPAGVRFSKAVGLPVLRKQVPLLNLGNPGGRRALFLPRRKKVFKNLYH